MSSGKGGGGGFLAGFVIGAIVGGVAAVLLVQEDARDMVVGKAREAGNFAKDATGDLRGKVGDVTTQWQSNASELYERGRQVVENARSNIDAAVSEGQESADRARQDLERQAGG
ncbi:MAG TPA: YtxH domain-containing protein [Candidatus Acidoferrales bacterium]|nr:YtxH domain-containing protein [Candidatus Acidoferrales bacterium]